MSGALTADVNAASNTSTSTYAELFVSGQVTICVPPYFERTRRNQRMPKKAATAIKTIAVIKNKSAVVSMFLTSFSGTAGKSSPLQMLLATPHRSSRIAV
jgi:hypothetical protein